MVKHHEELDLVQGVLNESLVGSTEKGLACTLDTIIRAEAHTPLPPLPEKLALLELRNLNVGEALGTRGGGRSDVAADNVLGLGDFLGDDGVVLGRMETSVGADEAVQHLHHAHNVHTVAVLGCLTLVADLLESILEARSNLTKQIDRELLNLVPRQTHVAVSVVLPVVCVDVDKAALDHRRALRLMHKVAIRARLSHHESEVHVLEEVEGSRLIDVNLAKGVLKTRENLEPRGVGESGRDAHSDLSEVNHLISILVEPAEVVLEHLEGG
mmetsp:Transcript_17249/g.33853  ORF Transcript_17249/g.33853 Transcript_17249/m.33853 type:complete len:270 (-) Transcript_17249:820-1629(-)